MSYYFDQKWYVVTYASGRKRMLCVAQETHDGFLGHEWDIEAEAKGKTIKFVPRSAIEEMKEVPLVEVHSQAIEVQTISRSRRVKPPRGETEPSPVESDG